MDKEKRVVRVPVWDEFLLELEAERRSNVSDKDFWRQVRQSKTEKAGCSYADVSDWTAIK